MLFKESKIDWYFHLVRTCSKIQAATIIFFPQIVANRKGMNEQAQLLENYIYFFPFYKVLGQTIICFPCNAKKKRKKSIFSSQSNSKCHLLTIWKGSLGVYHSQINIYLTEVCLHFFPQSKEVRKKLGVHITVEKERQNDLSESPQELVQRWCFFTKIILT